jgi:hypothetical protein
MSTRGRVDLLVAGLIAGYVTKQDNPLIEAVHDHFKPTIDAALDEVIGPKTQVGRRTRDAVSHAQDFHETLKRVKGRRNSR